MDQPMDQSMSEPRVDEVLQQLRAGVRQRQAELATAGAGTDEARSKLVELTSKEHIHEPVPFSPRPVAGKWIVFVRKAFFHLFLKWYMRPVLQQQNDFNQTAGRLIQELIQGQERLARQLRELDVRLTALERRARETPER